MKQSKRTPQQPNQQQQGDSCNAIEAKLIAQALEGNTTLERLTFFSNTNASNYYSSTIDDVAISHLIMVVVLARIGQEGGEAIAQVLKHDNTMTSLDLSGLFAAAST